VPLRNKRVLDVGGSVRAASSRCWVALPMFSAWNPRETVQAWAALHNFKSWPHRLGIANARIEANTVQTLQAAPRSFDVIILHNSSNHVDEHACIGFEKSEAARAKYRVVFEKLADIAAPGADLVIAGCTSSNIFPMLGLKHPGSQSIECEKRQPLEVWAREFENVGYENPIIRWTAYSRPGALGWALAANRWAAFLLTGHFMLRMRRRE
jgi:hypothetical protein